MISLASVEPMMLSEVNAPFDDLGWTAELKYDGYRLLAGVEDGYVRLKSRNGADATGWYPELHTLAGLRGAPLVLDGEVCMLDYIGRSEFIRLQDRSRRRGRPAGSETVVSVAFDLLVHRDDDIRALPLYERKERLRRLLSPAPAGVLFLAAMPGQVRWLYQQAVALELEGIVAKRLDSLYLSGQRTPGWLKVKRPGAIPPERFRR
jgi:bifunctional non-homologous end joining protein LigD